MSATDDWRPTAKAWSSRCARLARHGRALYRSDPDDPGAQRFFIVHGNAVVMVADVAGVEALIERLDVAAKAQRTSSAR